MAAALSKLFSSRSNLKLYIYWEENHSHAVIKTNDDNNGYGEVHI